MPEDFQHPLLPPPRVPVSREEVAKIPVIDPHRQIIHQNIEFSTHSRHINTTQQTTSAKLSQASSDSLSSLEDSAVQQIGKISGSDSRCGIDVVSSRSPRSGVECSPSTYYVSNKKRPQVEHIKTGHVLQLQKNEAYEHTESCLQDPQSLIPNSAQRQLRASSPLRAKQLHLFDSRSSVYEQVCQYERIHHNIISRCGALGRSKESQV